MFYGLLIYPPLGPGLKNELVEMTHSAEVLNFKLNPLNFRFQIPQQQISALEQVIEKFGSIDIVSDEDMQVEIFVSFNGEIHTFYLYPWNFTVCHMMALIESTIGIPVHLQHLYFQGRLLNAFRDLAVLPKVETMLTDFNVKEGSTLELIEMTL